MEISFFTFDPNEDEIEPTKFSIMASKGYLLMSSWSLLRFHYFFRPMRYQRSTSDLSCRLTSDPQGGRLVELPSNLWNKIERN